MTGGFLSKRVALDQTVEREEKDYPAGPSFLWSIVSLQLSW